MSRTPLRSTLVLVAMALAIPAGASAQSSGSTGTVTRGGTSGSSTSGTSGSGTASSGSSTGTTQSISSASSGSSSGSSTSRASASSGSSSATSSSASASGAAPQRSGGTLLGGQQDPEDDHHTMEEDDGRSADFIWIEANGGISYVNLVAFQQQNFSGDGVDVTLPGFTEVEGTGPMFGVGLGFRVFWFTLGARATLASYPGFEIGTVSGEVTLRLPVPVVEPWFRVSAGYAWQGNANYSLSGASSSQTNVYGWTMGGAFGLDVFFTWWFALGVGVDVGVLNMTRQTDITAPCMGALEFCPSQDGDAIGVQARGFLTAALHF